MTNEEISATVSVNDQPRNNFLNKFNNRTFLILFVTLMFLSLAGGIALYFSANKQANPTPVNKIVSKEAITIKSPVTTAFADYEPYRVEVTPSADSYNLPINLGEVKNKNELYWKGLAEQKLSQQGFAAIPSNFDQIYELYDDNKDKNRPNFVTSDSVLHTYHVLYDYTLRNLEINKFIPALRNLNKTILDTAQSQYASISDPKVKTAAKKNIAYLAVAAKLLDPAITVPDEVIELTEAELTLIEKHEGFEESPIFGYQEDYSQYVPRGHYTRNEDFKKYFKTMMWYGRMMFRIEPPDDKEKGR